VTNRAARTAKAPVEAPPANSPSPAPIPATSLPVSAELPAAPPAFDASTAGLDPLRPGLEAARGSIDRENLEELVVAADSVIGLQLEGGLDSERARVEDAVDARVIRDVRVGRVVAIPAGSRALGSVMLVERGGRLKDRARLGIRFHTLVLADGMRLAITTGTIYRYGDAPGDRSAKRIGGGAVAGAILGAIVGGTRGAAVGATAGAGGGTAMVMAGERSAAEFPSGTEVTARILDPVTVVVTQR
jgi:outer membrane lipoprotein SlyB